MNGLDLINKNVSKKMGLSLAGIIALVQAGAPSWQIMAIIIVYNLVQGFLDKKEKPKEKTVVKEKEND